MNEKKGRTFFIDLEGNDQHPGTWEQPFRSLEGARDAIRKIEKKEEDIIVYMRGGIYDLRDSIVFDEQDSGDNQCYITYRSYPGEQAVIRGGRKISGWTKVEDIQGRNLWKAKASEIEYTRHLYVNGKSAPRPCSEIKQTAGWEMAQDDSMKFWNLLETVTTFQGEKKVYEGYQTTNADMAKWMNQGDIEFVYHVGWTHSICPVESIVEEGDGALINMSLPCFKDCQVKGGVQIGTPNYIENVFELIDEPGEWYFNRTTREIYYFANEDENVNDLDIVVPLIEQLMLIRGTLEQPIRNLIFKDLEFSCTTWLRPATLGHAEIQANMIKDPEDNHLFHSGFLKPSSAIMLDAAEYVNFTGCIFHQLGCGAIDIDNGSRKNRIIGNRFISIAGSGIQIGGFRYQDAHPEDQRSIVQGNRVENNVFYDIGTEYKGSVAIIAGYTDGTVIRHNEISEVAYTGISVGWGWGYIDPNDVRFRNFAPEYYPKFEQESVARRNRIEYNHVHHVMRKLHDGGGIYTLSLQPDSTIIGNYVHSNGDERVDDELVFRGEVLVHNSSLQSHKEKYHKYLAAKGFPGGIYLDEGSGGFEVTGNIVHDAVVPIHYHEMVKDRFATNHIHDNILNIRPDEPDFPADLVKKAGLEPEYRGLLKG